MLRFLATITFCLLLASSFPALNLAHRSHGAFGIGPLNGLRQSSVFLLSNFCQPGQQKRMPSHVLSPAQLDFLCRRFGVPVVRAVRAGGGRLFPERDLLEFDGWTAEDGMAPRAEKRAYDYIRFGRRSVPMEVMEKKMAADKKAAVKNTYDYIRFGRRRR